MSIKILQQCVKELSGINTSERKYITHMFNRKVIKYGRYQRNATFVTYICMVLKLKTLHKIDQKYLESFQMRCWRRMEISWTDRAENEVLR
jgi:uncharacterized protein (UPF0332 family)